MASDKRIIYGLYMDYIWNINTILYGMNSGLQMDYKAMIRLGAGLPRSSLQKLAAGCGAWTSSVRPSGPFWRLEVVIVSPPSGITHGSFHGLSSVNR